MPCCLLYCGVLCRQNFKPHCWKKLSQEPDYTSNVSHQPDQPPSTHKPQNRCQINANDASDVRSM